MGRHGRRLARLEAAHRRPGAAAAGVYDCSALSPEEQFELDQLLAHLHPLPGEARARRPLTPAEQGRLDDLVARVGVAEGRQP